MTVSHQLESMPNPKQTNLAELTSKVLVQCFAPASVVTDLNGIILYVYGETGKYLRPAPGQASLSIIEMAREGLELELRSAINVAANDNMPTLGRETQVKTNGGFTTVSLSVRLLPNPSGDQNLLLVSFQDIASPVITKPGRKRVARPAELSRIEELERDLAYQKESNQAIIEEQQASNEELKSTNEELQSANEELQSTNEELETSKEELQSVNEELITVNSELHAKIEQLANMQNDMKNLLDNISVGIIFLDQHLMIRSFTRDAVRVYRLLASDVGRPLNDIKSVVAEDNLLPAAQSVLDSLIPFEQELNLGDGSWILVRIQPYRTLDNMIDGVVLIFTDITVRIKAIATQDALKLAQGIVSTITEPFIVFDGNLKVISASKTFYQAFQLAPEETLGHEIYEFGNRQWDIPAFHLFMEAIKIHGETFEAHELAFDFPKIGHRKMLLNARRIVGKVGEPELILLSICILS